MLTILEIAKKQGILTEYRMINEGQVRSIKVKQARNRALSKAYRLLKASDDSCLKIAMISLNNRE